MPGDYTRFTFRPRKGYRSVLRQQGRVALDADHNEAEAIDDRFRRSTTYDLLSVEDGGPAGLCVVPRSYPDAFLVNPVGNGFTLGPGRVYVDGIQVENFGRDPGPEEWNAVIEELYGTQPTPFRRQPFYASGPSYVHLPDPPANLPDVYIVYLDVWKREVDFLVDPRLREIALGGPDHGTRYQTVWQVRVLSLEGGDENLRCSDPNAAWDELIAPSAGRLTTSAEAPQPGDNPCILSPEGGYRGRENRLYRVEVHRMGAGGDFTFKWSRDNASVKASVSAVDPVSVTLQDAANNPVAKNVHRLTVSQLGRDELLRFVEGGWIEVLDGPRELDPERTGVLARVVALDEAERWITLDRELPADLAAADPASRHTRVIRWDQTVPIVDESADPEGGVPLQLGVQLPLEDGILVEFSLDPAGGRFQRGDFWCFAARTADSSVEALEEAPPRGIHHHYARLAIVNPAGFEDCRLPWPPEVVQGGDGEACCTEVVFPGESIQDAIDNLPEAGGCVCLKAGEHRVDAPIVIGRNNVHLHGESPGARVLRRSGSHILEIIGRGIEVEEVAFEAGDPTFSTVDGPLVIVMESQDVALRRCELRWQAPAATNFAVGTVGIEMFYSERVRVEECRVEGVWAGVLAAESTRRVTVVDSEFLADFNVSQGNYFGEVGVEIVTEGPSIVRDCHFTGFLYGVSVSGPAVDSVVEGCHITRTFFGEKGAPPEGLAYGIMILGAAGSRAVGNTIEIAQLGQGGIFLAGQAVCAEKNWIESELEPDDGELPIGILVGAAFKEDPGPASPGHAGALWADRAKVLENRTFGRLTGVLVDGTRGAEVRGNHLDGLAELRITAGVHVHLGLGAEVLENRIERFGIGIQLEGGKGNRVEGNALSDGFTGISLSGESDASVRDNRVERARNMGILSDTFFDQLEVRGNRLRNCAWEGFEDRPSSGEGMQGGIVVLAGGDNLQVEDNHVLDMGVPTTEPERSSLRVAGILLTESITCRVVDNVVDFSDVYSLPTSWEDRALWILGPLGAPVDDFIQHRGSVSIHGNRFTGVGQSCLVEVRKFVLPDGRVDHKFEKLHFADNLCRHSVGEGDVTEDKRWATVRLWGSHQVVTSNHVAAEEGPGKPAPNYPSIDFNDARRVALTSNWTTGEFIFLGSSIPAPANQFNVKL
jgi:parallel beta-helix repeat protein